MKLLDARRLTGINVIWDRPSAVLDVVVEPGDPVDELIERWRAHARAMLEAVDWGNEQTTSHRFAGGVSLALSAPIDGLYSAIELAEWAFETVQEEVTGVPGDPFDFHARRLRALVAEEANPALLELAAEAADRGVAFLWDDDEASVGLGKGSTTWASTKLPQNVDWASVTNIPIGVVTGTNGKTTTVRLASHIVRAAGLNAGLSSTDAVAVNDIVVEHGDFSGPGGARTVLRQTDVDVAILETARGGLLRRGLGVERADAALITNIAEDHLGDFGSQNLHELLSVKWVVTSALDRHSKAILNADDPLLVERAKSLTVPIVWFALSPANPVIAAHVRDGGAAVSVIDGSIARYDGREWLPLCQVTDVPITLKGIARHNTANALGAAGLTHVLGIQDDSISAGLRSMTADDNPGRCNFFSVNGRDVLLDFAHNPEGMAAIFEIARQHPAKRRLLAFAQAGDRTDASIRELARGAWAIGLDHVIVSELADYRRGREPGEVFGLMRDELLLAGANASQISHNELESQSLNEALERAAPGDLVIMLALSDTANLLQDLKSRAGA